MGSNPPGKPAQAARLQEHGAGRFTARCRSVNANEPAQVADALLWL